MNGTKLSLMLLLTAVACVNAEAPTKEVAQPAEKQAPQKSHFEIGKEYGSLMITAFTSTDQANEIKSMQEARSLIRPLLEEIQKKDAATAKASWKNFQEFNRGFKEVFDKDTPQPPTTLSALKKKRFALGLEGQKMSYNTALEVSDFEAFQKAVEEKSQGLRAKQLELQKEFQAQKATETK